MFIKSSATSRGSTRNPFCCPATIGFRIRVAVNAVALSPRPGLPAPLKPTVVLSLTLWSQEKRKAMNGIAPSSKNSPGTLRNHHVSFETDQRTVLLRASPQRDSVSS